jgi:hypothetical protein
MTDSDNVENVECTLEARMVNSNASSALGMDDTDRA